MAMVTEVSASAHPPLHSFSLRTSFSSAKPHKFCKIDLFRRSKFTKVVCLATPYRERTDRAKKRGGELYDQFGRSLSDLVPRTAKARKVSREKYREEKRKHSASDAKEDPRKTHRILQVIRGKARGRKLLSPTGMDVRPMMEVVRRASFDIIQVSCGCPTSLLPGRWLDLYSGTGSVGIEAISRGCSEVHFVEMDPWVVENVLRPNLIHTEFEEQSVIHMARVEAFLGESAKTNCKLGSFDYISVTPPYQLVDYAVLMDQLSRSTLVGEDSFILVEYPQKTVMHDFCGPLVKIVDRRYGRTYLAVYGPEWSRRRRQLKTASE